MVNYYQQQNLQYLIENYYQNFMEVFHQMLLHSHCTHTFLYHYLLLHQSQQAILGNIKANALTTLSKYPIKYLKLVFVSTNFEETISSTLTYQILINFFCSLKSFFCYFFLRKSQHYYTVNKLFVIAF